jgi:rare lipoprotein A (peptidoglycan hydrolase)
MGVAHRRLPCGTPVKFIYRGRRVVTRVIDRGPYARGFAWDLSNGVRKALGFEGSGRIRFAVARRYARH